MVEKLEEGVTYTKYLYQIPDVAREKFRDKFWAEVNKGAKW